MSITSWKKNRGLKLAWALGTAAIFLVSVLPLDQMPRVSLVSDKIEHLTAYGVVALLGFLAASNWQRRALLALAMVAMGIAIEFVQAVVPGRSFELLDMVANGAGVALAGVVTGLYLRFQGPAPERQKKGPGHR